LEQQDRTQDIEIMVLFRETRFSASSYIGVLAKKAALQDLIPSEMVVMTAQTSV
jgi:hypothetical protein